MTTPPLLQMTGITKFFPGVAALDKVNLQVTQGEVVALCGENGAGKSTLMKILGGIYLPDSGDIFFEAKRVKIQCVSDAISLGIAFIHQELNVLDNLDIAANVFLGREPVVGPFQLINRRKIHAETEPYLKRLGLGISSSTRLDKLSLGQQQLVEIARALSLDARLIIMDEPSSSLTLAETDRLLELVGELSEQGIAIIYISHRLGEIGHCAHRVIVLRDGKNAGELDHDKISHDRIVNLMVGREIKGLGVQSTAPRPGFLIVRDLRSSRYPEKPVSFDARQGEILGFAGMVGAGPLEIAKAIVGLDPFASGDVIVGGEKLQVGDQRGAVSRGIYLVPEDRRREGLVGSMCVRENITLPSIKRFARFKLIRRELERNASEEQISLLNIKTRGTETLVMNLSGGNQQKVVLGKWLAMNPKVMILDEPTRGIDIAAKAEVYGIMRNLAMQGAAILMISSDMEEILRVSDRVVVMHEGEISGVLDRQDCTEENIMQLAVGKRILAAKPAF